MLELIGIKKVYKNKNYVQTALNNVNLKFRKKEFVSILGESGSGKTTLLNIIGGLDKYTDGDFIINGISTKDYDEKSWDIYRNKNVGFIFQNYNLINNQSILFNVELALSLNALSKKKRRKLAINALRKVGLVKYMNKKPNELSGGQMQRVAIARSIVNNPDIILADEPTGALDLKNSYEVMNILKEISKEKLVIVVTHNSKLALKYSTRTLKIRDGKIIYDSNKYLNSNSCPKMSNIKRRKLPIFMAIKLSFNNLLAKKGRTILTTLANSIGIIGITVILSFCNGIDKYINNLEEKMVNIYPIVIQRKSVINQNKISEKKKYNKNKIYAVKDDSIKIQDTKKFKKYLNEKSKDIEKYSSNLNYGYDISMNLYKNNGNILSKVSVPDENLFFILSEDNAKSFKIIDGTFPKNYNDIVLIIDENNEISKETLRNLGIIDTNTNDEKTIYKPSDFIGLTYKLALNVDYYKKENNVWINMIENESYLDGISNKLDELKIVGVVKKKNGDDLNNYGKIGYSPLLVNHMINKINNSLIVNEQINNKNINVFTNMEFTNSRYLDNLNILNVVNEDIPDVIYIYPKDFNSKKEIINLIDNYNLNEEKIDYIDSIGSLLNSISLFTNIISKVLIMFVFVSLVVSSIMMSVITYISVIERTREIGILRSLGMSKGDISKIFNVETILEGLFSGIFGVSFASIINLLLNLIIKNEFKVSLVVSAKISNILSLIMLSIFLALLSGYIPSKMAGKKEIVLSLKS